MLESLKGAGVVEVLASPSRAWATNMSTVEVVAVAPDALPAPAPCAEALMNITGLDGDLSALSIDQSEIVSATLLWAGLGAVLLLGMTFYMGTNAAGQVIGH